MKETTLAALPWYDLPSVRWANDTLWRASGLPGALDRTLPAHAQWRAPELLVSQACGLDLFLSDAPIEPVLAPVFDLDCAPGEYFSYLIGDPRGRVAAVNSLSSHSGLTALLSLARPEAIRVTGSHLASLAEVRAGLADVAAIDAVTWRIVARDTPELIRDLRIADRSATWTAPPYVVRRLADAAPVVAGLRRAIQAEPEASRALQLTDVRKVSRDDYASVWEAYLAIAERIPRDRCTIVGEG